MDLGAVNGRLTRHRGPRNLDRWSSHGTAAMGLHQLIAS
jgi:hypothetical protein